MDTGRWCRLGWGHSLEERRNGWRGEERRSWWVEGWGGCGGSFRWDLWLSRMCEKAGGPSGGLMSLIGTERGRDLDVERGKERTSGVGEREGEGEDEKDIPRAIWRRRDEAE